MMAAEQKKFRCMPYTFILSLEKWGVGRTNFVLKNTFEKQF
jgi:hypothetical protein